MTVEVLLSCMHLNTDEDLLKLVERTNIKGKAVIVSQCDRDGTSLLGDIKVIYTTERGLSRSRNMAIRHSTGDICVICDDDEILVDNLESIINNAYNKYPDASLIAFALNRRDGNKVYIYPKDARPLGFKQILSTSSVQISFRRADLIKFNIQFDELMGSGTGNGSGEENKFLLDFRKHRSKMMFCPDIIASLLPGESQWFKGYDKTYIQNLGWSSRRAMGNFLGFVYIHYWVICHYGLYSERISLPAAYKCILSGFF